MIRLALAFIVAPLVVGCGPQTSSARDPRVAAVIAAPPAQQTPASPPVAEPVAQVAQRPTGERVRLKHLRRSTPDEKAKWESAVDTLWSTPLGELYGEYLFSPSEDHADLPLWARLLTERMFREPNLLTVRVAALQIMTEDLYVREKMTADVSDRVLILNTHIDQKRMLLDQSLHNRTFMTATPFVVGSLIYGSRAVRQEIGRIGIALFKRARGQTLKAAQRPRPSRMWRDFGEDYSFMQAANFMGLTYVPVQGMMYLRNDVFYASRFAPRDQVLLLGLDDLVRAMELPGTANLPVERAVVEPGPQASLPN